MTFNKIKISTVAPRTRRHQSSGSCHLRHKTEIVKKWLSLPPFLLLLPQKEWVFENPPSQETNVCIASEVFICLQFENYSSWTMLQGCSRLFHVFKDRAKTDMKAEHFATARNDLSRCSKTSPFAENLAALLKGKPLGHKDKLLLLGPFPDDEGLIRAIGRLTEKPEAPNYLEL